MILSQPLDAFSDSSPLVEALALNVALDRFPVEPHFLHAFGISTPAHFEVLSVAMKSGDLSPADLENVAGNPRALNQLLEMAPSLEKAKPLPDFSAAATR